MKRSKLFSVCVLAAVVLLIVRVSPENSAYASDIFVLNNESAEEQVIYSEIISAVADVDVNIYKPLSGENVIFSAEPIATQSDNDYTVMHFEIPKNMTAIDSSTGQRILLFTHTIYGSFYYYNDGKVHLYSLGSYISNLRPNYSATITGNIIHNTDGTFSTGESTVVTSSSLSGYPTPTLHIEVRFDKGSTDIGYRVMEQY